MGGKEQGIAWEEGPRGQDGGHGDTVSMPPTEPDCVQPLGLLDSRAALCEIQSCWGVAAELRKRNGGCEEIPAPRKVARERRGCGLPQILHPSWFTEAEGLLEEQEEVAVGQSDLKTHAGCSTSQSLPWHE